MPGARIGMMKDYAAIYWPRVQIPDPVTGIQRFIDFSTSEVFGTYAFRVREADVTSLGAVGEARWTYAVSKLATEHLAHNYYSQYKLPTCSIRPALSTTILSAMVIASTWSCVT